MWLCYSEARDLEACNSHLFSLEQSRGDVGTPILCPNMDKNKIEAARAEKCVSYVIQIGEF